MVWFCHIGNSRMWYCCRVQLFVLVCVVLLPLPCVVLVAFYVPSVASCGRCRCCGSAISATVGCGIVVRVGTGSVPLLPCWWFYIASCGRWCVCVVLVAFYVPSVASCGRCCCCCVLWFCYIGNSRMWSCGRVQLFVLVCLVLRCQLCQLWPCVVLLCVCCGSALPAVAVLPLLWFYYRQRSVVPVW